jgi:uncharacterized repeat protein (TIGR04076 family)
VLKVGKEGKAETCRLGLEHGDTFECDYETPGGFYPTWFIKIFPVLEIMRSEGGLRYLGASKPNEMVIVCPDGAVRFRVRGVKLE